MTETEHPFPLRDEPVAGVDIRLGGHVFCLPPASLFTLKKYSKAIADLQKNPQAMFEESGIDTVVGVLHAALLRNHPGITQEWVSEHIGLESVVDVFPLALDVAGLIRKQREADAKGAEGKPLQDGDEGLGELTGTRSLPTS